MTVENVELVNRAEPESHMAVSVLPLGSHPQSVIAAIGWAQFDPYARAPTANVGQYNLMWSEQPKRIIAQDAIKQLLSGNGLVRGALTRESVPLAKVVSAIREARDTHGATTVWMYRQDVLALDSLLGESELRHPLDGMHLMDPPTAFAAMAAANGGPMPVRDETTFEPQYSVIGDVAWLVRAVRELYNPSTPETIPAKGAA